MRALLSIKPKFAESIFSGDKRFEFRRIIFKRPITKVIVYASSPIRKVIGEFEVESVVCDNLDILWSHTQQYAGISKQVFDSYFNGKSKGYAIKIGDTYLYNEPKDIENDFGVKPPQSFIYL